MWDENTPLQLLKTMPKVLEKEHLEKLQLLFEADKYKDQIVSGFDVCGQGKYAPFCSECDKENKYPCAVAYVNFMKAQGTDIEIASEVAESVEEENPVEPQPLTGSEEATTEEKPEKTKIRIAIARKKTLL